MKGEGSGIARFRWLGPFGLTIGALACTGEEAVVVLTDGSPHKENPAGPSAPTLELLGSIGSTGMYSNTWTRLAFRFTNPGPDPIGIRGLNGVHPSTRQRYRVEGQWIEGTPVWTTCATGVSTGELAAGASVELQAFVERPDLPIQFGAGYWKKGTHPESWREWTWVWAEPIVAAELGGVGYK